MDAHVSSQRKFQMKGHVLLLLTQFACAIFFCTVLRSAGARTDSNLLANALQPASARALALSRYTQPPLWMNVSRIRLPTLAESRYRILYSPIRVTQGDGMGHAMATVNIEVTAALRLGITYTHRRPMFGTLSDGDPDAVENFFGWGRNELSGQEFFESNCIPTPNSHNCRICGRLNENSIEKSLVELPNDLITMDSRENELLKFIEKNNQSHTVFTIQNSICAASPAYSDFTLSRPWFFWKYWDNRAAVQDLVDPGSQNESTAQDLDFSDREISIAVHVRRGDFFEVKSRKLLKCSTYAQIIRTVQDVIEGRDDRFSNMPVAVYIYSEGKPKAGYGFGTHDMRRLTEDFLDENKIVRDAAWWTDLLARTSPQTDPTSTRRRQPSVPRVELRISKSTLSSTHQMIAADVFIGSVSGLSTNLVRALSRGVQIFPGGASRGRYCCAISADVNNGLIDREAFAVLWSSYTTANKRFLT